MSADRCFRASAPVRLDFAGGWTDVAPFATEVGGAVVNAAIELRVHAEVRPGGNGVRLDAEDLGRRTEVAGGTWTSEQSAGFPLQRAALQRVGMENCALRTRSDVPPGSGLGSSGALGVALVAALETALGRASAPGTLAEAAFRLEAVDARLPGGKQDQYAAALGGFHRLGFTGDAVRIEPLALEPGFVRALGDSIVLCYTGTSRVSSNTISRVMGAYTAGNAVVTAALHGMVEVAERMVDALRAADLGATGRLLSENWRLQQQLDAGMCTAEMAALERALLEAGILGGKAAGAGAGGSMFFITRDRHRAERSARAAGARVLPVQWAAQGVTRESPA